MGLLDGAVLVLVLVVVWLLAEGESAVGTEGGPPWPAPSAMRARSECSLQACAKEVSCSVRAQAGCTQQAIAALKGSLSVCPHTVLLKRAPESHALPCPLSQRLSLLGSAAYTPTKALT